MASEKTRQKIVDTFLALVGEHGWQPVSVADVAAGAGVKLSVLRGEFDSKIAFLEAFSRRTDQAVLDGIDRDMADEPARERLFDTLMRRLELLAGQKDAIRAIARAARSDPGLAVQLNRIATTSQMWMLTAAGIDAAGPRGRVKAQGLAVAFARVLRVWLKDDDPGLARTMAKLDRELARGARALDRLDGLAKWARRLSPFGSRKSGEREADQAADPDAAPAGSA